MRTLTIALIALLGALALAGAAHAKDPGPLRAEISGGGLIDPVAVEGPLSADIVFTYDDLALPAPGRFEPAYTVKLMPAEPDGATGEYPFIWTLTYFPGEGDEPALLAGDWDSDRYFHASTEFQSTLDEAIASATAGDDGGLGSLWYIGPGLALGLLAAGGIAGRRLVHRQLP